MTELQLYKFIKDNNIEWHKHDRDGGQDVIIFVAIYLIKDFQKMLPQGIFDDDGIECTMKDGYFAFWMKDICDYCGVEMNNVFKGNNYDE